MSRRSGFFSNWWAWVVPILIVIGAALYTVWQMNPSQTNTSIPMEVSVVKAAEYRENGAFMLDVRQPDEWIEGHIPGATLIPLGELSTRLSEVPKDRTIVVVCRSGNRSAQGRDLLRQAGYKEVTSMGGGMRDWITQGMEFITGTD